MFTPVPKREARKKLGLNPDGKYLLWAAGGRGNRRKGYHLAVEAMERLQANEEVEITFLTMGGKEGWDKPDKLTRVKHYGYVRESEKQALIFSAADAFLCTTLADGQPQTVLESLACGTPVIAFDVGPLPNLVENDKTGRIAQDKTSQSLVGAVQDFFEQDDSHPFMQDYCRKEALQKYDLAKQTDKYVDLYEVILKD